MKKINPACRPRKGDPLEWLEYTLSPLGGSDRPTWRWRDEGSGLPVTFITLRHEGSGKWEAEVYVEASGYLGRGKTAWEALENSVSIRHERAVEEAERVGGVLKQLKQVT